MFCKYAKAPSWGDCEVTADRLGTRRLVSSDRYRDGSTPGIENTNRHRGGKPQSECEWKHGDNGANDNRQEHHRRRGGMTARCARMRRCLTLRQGARPLRPPAPFPWSIDCTQASESVKGSLPRHKPPPLTASLPCEETRLGRGKGAFGKRQHPASPWSATGSNPAGEQPGALCAP
jgi:hypothetical protein